MEWVVLGPMPSIVCNPFWHGIACRVQTLNPFCNPTATHNSSLWSWDGLIWNSLYFRPRIIRPSTWMMHATHTCETFQTWEIIVTSLGNLCNQSINHKCDTPLGLRPARVGPTSLGWAAWLYPPNPRWLYYSTCIMNRKWCLVNLPWAQPTILLQSHPNPRSGWGVRVGSGPPCQDGPLQPKLDPPKPMLSGFPGSCYLLHFREKGSGVGGPG